MKIVIYDKELENKILRNKKIKVKKIAPMDIDKLKETNLLFHKIDKNSIDVARLFIGCLEILRSIDDEDIKDYVEIFSFTNELPLWIEEVRKDNYGSVYYSNKIKDIVSGNRGIMLNLIYLTQNKFKIFSEDEEEFEEDESEQISSF